MNAQEIAERLARQARENQRNRPKSDVGATQSGQDISTHQRYTENASKRDLTPTQPARDWWHVYKTQGENGIDVFFAPPQKYEDVRKIFYPHAFSVIAMDQK